MTAVAAHTLAPPVVPGLWAPAGPPVVELVVYAKSAPKGSKDYKGSRRSKKTGRLVPVLVESAAADLDTFTEAVLWVAKARLSSDWTPLEGPVAADITFTMPRPKNHYGTGRNAGVLKPWARDLIWHRVYPDCDKLQRALGDALTKAGVWRDDGQLAAHRYGPFKVYEKAPFPDALHKPGVVVRLWNLDDADKEGST